MTTTKTYLQMEPIIGDSKNPQFKKAVEIDSWSFNADAQEERAVFNDNRRTELSVFLSKDSRAGNQFFIYYLRPDPATFVPDFEGGQHVFKEAVLTIEKLSANNKLKKFTIMKMSPVIIASLCRHLSSDNRLVSEITLRFKKIEYIIPE